MAAAQCFCLRSRLTINGNHVKVMAGGREARNTETGLGAACLAVELRLILAADRAHRLGDDGVDLVFRQVAGAPTRSLDQGAEFLVRERSERSIAPLRAHASDDIRARG